MEPNQKTLELDPLLDVEFGHQDHSSCMNDEGRYLRDHEYSESFVGEVIVDLFEGSALACAGPSGNCDFIDGVFGVVAKRGMLDMVLEVDVVE